MEKYINDPLQTWIFYDSVWLKIGIPGTSFMVVFDVGPE
jgi:hypothetical protein